MAFVRLDRALAVDRIAQRIDDTAEQAFADGDIDDGAGPLDGVAFLDVAVAAEDHGADIVGFQVQGHAADTTREFDQLAGLDIVETVNAGHAVTDGDNLSDLGNIGLGAEPGDLFFDD